MKFEQVFNASIVLINKINRVGVIGFMKNFEQKVFALRMSNSLNYIVYLTVMSELRSLIKRSLACKMQDLTPLLVTPLLANVANNKLDTSLAVLSVAGGYLGVAACPTNGATCFIGATGITLGTDQLTKILYPHPYLLCQLLLLYSLRFAFEPESLMLHRWHL